MSLEEYKKALKSANRRSSLPFLEEDVSSLSTVYLGVSEIPVSMIRGTFTDTRSSAFSDNWMPMLDEGSEFAYKWSRLYDSQIEEGLREPITVYEYKRSFYVVEGNKRVSVMSYLQAPVIMADVTRIIPQKEDTDSCRLYEEYTAFQKCTGIWNILFTIRGGYEKLAAEAGMDLEHPWPMDLARNLQGAFFRFSQICSEISKRKAKVNVSDAFLLYFSIFTLDSLLDRDRRTLRSRTERIWNEFTRQSSSLSETPVSSKRSPLGLSWIIPQYSERHPLKISFLYEGDSMLDSWAADHETGRMYINKRFEGIVTADSGLCSKETLNKAAGTHDLVITTSKNLLKDTLAAAADHPETMFLNFSAPLESHVIRTYFGRTYEPLYLTGILAALLTKKDYILYRHGSYQPETVSSLNAFAAGVSMIRPDIKVVLYEGDDTAKMLDAYPADLAFLYQPKNDAVLPGLYRITGGNYQSLSTVIWNWPVFYEKIISDYLYEGERGGTEDLQAGYWLGLSSGVIDLRLSDSLHPNIHRTVEFFRNGVIDQRLNPFRGPLKDQSGSIAVAADKNLTARQIISMNWLLENIIGNLPENLVYRSDLL